MKFGARAVILFLTVLVFVCRPSFADDNKPKDKNVATPASSASDPNAKKDVASDAKAAPDPGASPAVPAPPSAASNASNDEDATQQRKWAPMPALDGTPGLFTLGTGDTLPKGGFDIVAGVNKFSRMPGDITVLQVIPSFGVGITNWFTAFLSIDADEHIHVDQPTLLSLNSTNGLQYLNTIYSPFLPCSVPALCPPAYVEDFPFASHNGGGVGEIDLGFKIGLLSERRGKPFSLSIRNDFYIPTQSGFSTLLSNQVQTGQFNYGVDLEASKTLFHHSILATINWGYRFTRQATYTVEFSSLPGPTQGVLKLADQMPIGAGLLIFPEKRFQIISEYDGLIYIGKGIQNTTFGARDPVDSLMGFRLYAVKNLALDVGYRYNLNLTNHQDRNGFVVKIAFARWPEKPLPPDNVTATCSADKTSVMEGSSDYVTANVAATDANGRPLNYSWTASGGKLIGTGPYVRWDPTGVGGGSYVLTARVDNGAGKSASCSSSIAVQPKPLAAPTMSCSATPATVIAGERPTITATVNDPSGTPITYTWQANAGQIIGSGASVQFDTSGLAPATYTVTGRAENAVHSACDCSTTVTVQAPAPAPEASKISECSFAPNSVRTDNVCKRTLDDVAVRLQTDAKTKIVVVGYAEPKERGAQKLATERAESAKKYLNEKKSVDTSRVEVRTNTEAGKEGRRVEIILVPDGATY
jgi:outer membrane protein OmpA-like peptidoglycan-associated protein